MKQRRFMHPLIERLSLGLVAMLMVGLALSMAPTQVAQAATFSVTKTTDTADGTCDADCSLREAIIAANTAAGGDTITVPAGTYTLTIAGAGEDAAATGDLDITDNLTITGALNGSAVIAGGGIDRVFHIPTAGATVTISGLTIRDGNAAGNLGGAILNSTGTLVLMSSSVISNIALIGAGIFSFGPLTLTGSSVISNTAINAAGGIYSAGPFTLSDSSVISNTAIGGAGGIFSTNLLTVTSSSIISNTTTTSLGGGLYISSGRGTISNTLIHDNAAPTNGGGGIANNIGTLTITASIISSNTARFGGGVFNSAPLTVTTSLISDNSASNENDSGGGIFNSAVMTMTNSTISGNRAAGNGGGYHGGSSTPGLNAFNLTIANNIADSNNNAAGTGGGIFSDPADIITIKNSILAGNLAGTLPSDCTGSLSSRGHNLIETTTGCTIGGDTTGNITGQDPNLGPLQDNGGPTPTHALPAGSPALNVGSPATPGSGAGACEATDQRGIVRPQQGRCDIGAFELASAPTLTKGFSPATIVPGATATVTFTITNALAGNLISGVTFTDTMPSAIQVAAAPAISNTCGGAVSAVSSTSVISLTGGTVAAGANCTISVAVTSTTLGSHSNTTGPISSTETGAGATSNTATLNITNPVPTITAISPGAASVQSGGFTLIVTGTNFIQGVSVLRWNGTDRPTTVTSPTRLQASIPASDLATVGTASVTVFNSAPGGGTSNALTFTIQPVRIFLPLVYR